MAVGDPAILPASFTFSRAPATRRSPITSRGYTIGTRGGLMARPTLPLDGEYVIKVKLLQTNLGSVRGLEYTPAARDLGGRRACAPRAEWAGPADLLPILPRQRRGDRRSRSTRASSSRVPIAATHHHVSGATFVAAGPTRKAAPPALQPFSCAATVDAHRSHGLLPHVSRTSPSPARTTRRGSGDTPSRRKDFRVPPRDGRRGGPCASRILSMLARRAIPPPCRRRPT